MMDTLNPIVSVHMFTQMHCCVYGSYAHVGSSETQGLISIISIEMWLVCYKIGDQLLFKYELHSIL